MYDNIHVMFCDSKKNAKWTVLSILKRVNELYELGRLKCSSALILFQMCIAMALM